MENKTNVKIITCNDGSHTLYSNILQESFHSTYGAIQESMYIFISKGLHYFIQQKDSSNKEIKILEIGFGTGLNAILTIKETQSIPQKIYYEALEPFPLPIEVIDQLNYPKILQSNYLAKTYAQIHKYEWEGKTSISEKFILNKRKITLEEYKPTQQFDIVYFDAFSPKKQPEVWTKDCIKKIYESLSPKGILITYCAQGNFKKTLKETGFAVQSLPGPPGKKEITRAIK